MNNYTLTLIFGFLILITSANILSQCTRTAIIDNANSQLNIINLENGLVESTIFVPQNSFVVSTSADGNIGYVGVDSNGGLYIYDLNTSQLLSSFPAIGQIQNLAVTNDGQTLYALSAFGNVTVVNLLLNQIDQVITGVAEFFSGGLYLSIDGSYLYISGTQNFVRLNTSDFTTELISDAGGNRFNSAVTCDNRFALLTNFSGGVEIYDLEQNSLINTVDIVGNPFAITISPNQQYAYVTLVGTNEVAVIDLQNMSLNSKISISGTPRDIGTSFSGDEVYVTLSNGNVSVIDTQQNIEVSTFNVAPSLFGTSNISCRECNPVTELSNIPTLSEWGLILLLLLLLIVAITQLQSRITVANS